MLASRQENNEKTTDRNRGRRCRNRNRAVRGICETILKLPDMYELCAFCDCDPNRVKEAGRTYGVKAQYTNLDDMLR